MSIGEISRLRKQQNMDDVLKFFTENPFATQLECAKATGLSKMTVNRHVKELKAAKNEEHSCNKNS